jgi:hypothetical protein
MKWPLPTRHCLIPEAVVSKEVTLPDSIMLSHRYYDHPTNFEHGVPGLISHERNNSDEESFDNATPTNHRNVRLNTLTATTPTTTAPTSILSGQA